MDTDKIYAEHIANEYSRKETSKVVALKKLDRKAKRGATVFAFAFGIIMALLLGVGMCLCMNVIGDGSTLLFVIGIICGVVGIAGCGVNYPIYSRLLQRGKDKYAFEILELAKEIQGEEEKEETK